MERAMPGHGMRDLRPSLTGIPWRSAPKVGPRAVVAATFGACSGLVQAGGRAVDWSYPVADAVAEGTVLRVGPGYVAMGLDLLSESNGPLRRWGYFNYLLYAATHYAAGRPTKFFADWPASPVPHGTAKAVWLVIVALVWPVTLAAYFWARRAARRETQRSAGAATVRFFHTLTRSNPNAGGPGSAAWSKVGFERPLAGWWTLVASFVVVIIPYVLVVQFLLPTYVQKFPEAEGMGATVSEFFWWVWILFDLGTSTAFVKQFAELRVRNPQRALAAMQAYNWWQIFTGALQLTLIGLLGAYVVPHTRYALMAHLVAVAGVGQWPGVFGSIAYFFQATQRYDYYQTVDLLQNRLLVVVLPIPFILVGRAWGLHQLEYGEAYGAVLGMAAGGYAVSLTGLAISYLLLRRMGVGLRPLFLASFDRGTLGRLLAYGWKIAASGLPFRLANTFELGMLVALLLSYNESVGIKSFLETKLVFFFMFLYSWCEPAIAPFSEAHGAGKKVLVQYYIARYLQFGHLFVAALFSFLAAVGPLFVRSALDAQWAAAAVLVPLAAIRGLLLPSAWVGDMVQKGCGRPGMNAWLLVGEQLARLALFWLLIPRLQLVGVLLAVVGTLVLKAVVGWTLIHRWIVRVRVPLWSAVLAPLAAGGLNFGLWRILVELLSAGGLASLGRWGALGTMLAASVAALPSCLWLMGLLGGYDPKALGELVGAAEMAGALSPVARRLAAMARHGAALHDRVAGRLVGLGWARGAPGAFSQELVEGAEAEARQLELAEGQAVDSVAAGCGATVPAEVTSTGPASVAQEPHGASR
jgi:O-antigen/teichoic acid export membrane protein